MGFEDIHFCLPLLPAIIALASGISFRGAPLRTAPVDSRTRLVYVRDLPVEVPSDGLKVFLRAFGVVHSVVEQTHPGMPNVYTGTRVVKVTLSKDLPSSARVSGFDVRFWYQGQPRVCPVCRSYGHRVKDCPFNGVCRRCRLPGHMARECPSRRSTVEPASAAPSVPETSSVADPRMSEDEEADDPDYVSSTASEPGSCSGDDEVIQWSTALSPGRERSFSESDTSIFVFCDEEETESTVDPVPGKPVIAFAASTPAAPVGSSTPVSASAVSTPVPVSTPAVPDGSGTPVSASAGPTPAVSVPVKPSVPVSGRKKPPPPAVAPSTEPIPSFWDRTRRRCFAFGGVDAAGESISLEFGTLTRSILRDSSTFEIDRFYKYRDRLVRRPYQAPRNVPNLSLRAGTPLKFPKSSK